MKQDEDGEGEQDWDKLKLSKKQTNFLKPLFIQLYIVGIESLTQLDISIFIKNMWWGDISYNFSIFISNISIFTP